MRKSYVAAAVIVLGLGAWMGSPYLLGHKETEAPADTSKVSADTAKAPFKVRVRTFTASQREAVITANGVTAASARVEVRARTSGIVEASPFKQGQSVKTGDVLCKLDMAARSMQQQQAEAAVKSSERNFNASRKLAKKDFVSEQKVLEDKAKLDTAKTGLEQVQMDIGWTDVKAPSNGVLIEKPAEDGALMVPGAVCATIAVLDPILVAVQVSERYLPYLREGMVAKAKLATGEEVEGKVTLISKTAELATRTFRVELSVANAAESIREGVTAEIFMSTPPVPAHLLPASAMMLDDEGRFGVRLMQDDSTSRFTPVTVIAQEREGFWVSGLGLKATIVVVGQDYVKDGEKVEAVSEIAEAKP